MVAGVRCDDRTECAGFPSRPAGSSPHVQHGMHNTRSHGVHTVPLHYVSREQTRARKRDKRGRGPHEAASSQSLLERRKVATVYADTIVALPPPQETSSRGVLGLTLRSLRCFCTLTTNQPQSLLSCAVRHAKQ